MQGREKLDPLKVLTTKQENFSQEYIINGGHAQNAYLAAYDTTNRTSASVAGIELTNNPLVANRIIHLKKQALQAITIDPTMYVLSSLIELNETSLNDFIDDKGHVIALNKMPKNKTKAIAKLKIINNTDSEGNHKQTIDITLIDRLQVIEKIAKHINFYSLASQEKDLRHTTANRNRRGKDAESSEKQINLQQNFYNPFELMSALKHNYLIINQFILPIEDKFYSDLINNFSNSSVLRL